MANKLNVFGFGLALLLGVSPWVNSDTAGLKTFSHVEQSSTVGIAKDDWGSLGLKVVSHDTTAFSAILLANIDWGTLGDATKYRDASKARPPIV